MKLSLPALPPLSSKVRVYPAEEVETRDPEVYPRDVDLDRAAIEGMWESVRALYATGLHPAIGLCVRRRGQVVLDRSIGHARGNAPGDGPDVPKVLATPRTLYNIYSASKAVTAMLIHLLDQRGQLHLDDPVAEYLPEFGRKGKEWMTIRHLLTHRAGIPNVPRDHINLDLLSDPWKVVELLCDTKPVSIPGREIAYHALTGGYILGAVVDRIVGRDVRSFLKSEIEAPLGFSHFNYGVAPDEVDLVAQAAFTGPPTLPPYSWVLERAFGVDMRNAVSMSNDPRFLTAVIASGNIITTAREVTRFFQILLENGELDGVRIFDRRTVQRAVAEQSHLQVDSALGLPVRYGMGFMLGSKWVSFYGHESTRAFGHLGFTSILCWADPERQISVCLMTSGKPVITLDQLVWLNVPRTIARLCPRG
ncbi:MAG: serine hydrolase domain-containing protein [Byssovorax sp.]